MSNSNSNPLSIIIIEDGNACDALPLDVCPAPPNSSSAGRSPKLPYPAPEMQVQIPVDRSESGQSVPGPAQRQSPSSSTHSHGGSGNACQSGSAELDYRQVKTRSRASQMQMNGSGPLVNAESAQLTAEGKDGGSLRRSPRLSSVTPQPQILPERSGRRGRDFPIDSEQGKSTRRSPRLGNSSPGITSRELEVAGGSGRMKSEGTGKRGGGNQRENLLPQRRSPRLGNVEIVSVPEVRKSRESGFPNGNNKRQFDGSAARRSPRFSPDIGLELMELPLLQSKRQKVRGLSVNGGRREEGAKELSIVRLSERNQTGSQAGSSRPGIGIRSSNGTMQMAPPCIHNRDGETEALAASCCGSVGVFDENKCSISPEYISLTESAVGNDMLGSVSKKLLDGKPLTRCPGLVLPSNIAKDIDTVCSLGEMSHLLDKQLLEKSLTLCTSSSHSAVVEQCKMNYAMVEFPELFDELPAKNKSDDQLSLDKRKQPSLNNELKEQRGPCLIGDPIASDEAQKRWHWRYELKSKRSRDRRLKPDEDDEDQIIWNVECHYAQAEVDGCVFDLEDCANIRGQEGQMHIGKIVEFFRSTDEEDYFRVQWFYKAEDTIMKEQAASHDTKRVFYSTVMNDNPIDCISSKVNIMKISPKIVLKRQLCQKFDFYFDMEYCVEYSTFRALTSEKSSSKGLDSSAPSDLETTAATDGGISALPSNISGESVSKSGNCKRELVLLDLFSGCGGMSTGLCMGSKLSDVDLVMRWALDSNKYARESLKLNHPGTQVRGEPAEDFLALLKEWEKLCKKYMDTVPEKTHSRRSMASKAENWNDDRLNEADVAAGEFEVSKIVDICFGHPSSSGNHGLKLKVHWKGYSVNDDTWEPIESLSGLFSYSYLFVPYTSCLFCLDSQGDVDVVCGGPPCQGISGYNRFRNFDSPLDDERNQQIGVFMDIVQFLKPNFVLMENVVDILRFDKASLARYALSRLVQMKYQARLGTVAAGCYGLPQFRLRVFLWGAHPCEKLPQFPLPTHDVVVRYWPPPAFERNTVAYDEDQPRPLEKALVLEDAISDLPAVSSNEHRDEMPYDKPPETEFQRFIRSPESEMIGHSKGGARIAKDVLYDHRPYSLSEEDYARVCQIPKKKGANFRDLPGVVVGADNVARRDQKIEQVILPSGKPLVPDFALKFSQGKSRRPYGRLWWDETVPTVVTYPDLHSQAVLHPDQDRVLTIRECARLQGFPDYYRFCGSVKARYRQIGNAVAVPVGRALGYAMGLAALGLGDDGPLMTLPKKFSHSTNLQLSEPEPEPEPELEPVEAVPIDWIS
ncbi:unnamed protein product [Linum tenue]|uniref:Cytosine-specific methyltransferase n=2 Tax=Linum tenue TaxID=586396 RepID=A0AAV0K8X5_9ROSI|nr:unnamed protein product [Linum tenue]